MLKLPRLKLTKKTLIAIAGLFALILLVGGFLYYQQAAHEKKLAEIEDSKVENIIIKARLYREKNPFDTYYVKLTSDFYNRLKVNVPDGKFRTYLTAEIMIKVQNAKVGSDMKNILPKLEHEANTLLSSTSADELKTIAGRNRVTQQLLLFANNLLDPELTALYANQFSAYPVLAKDQKKLLDPLPFEITADDLPVQAVVFESFILNR